MATAHPTTTFRDFLPGQGTTLPHLLDERAGFTYTFKARGAIEHFLRRLRSPKRRVVLVPTLHCPTVVQPILRAGFDVRFFAINEDLSVDHTHLAEQLGADVALVVLIHYFGFENNAKAVANATHAAGALLLEDWSHSFLRAAPLRLSGEHGDVAVYSPWKLVPCGTAGLIRALSASGDVTLSAMHAAPVVEQIRLYKRMLEESFLNLEARSWLRRAYVWAETLRVARKSRDRAGEPQNVSVQQSSPLEAFYAEHDVYFDGALPRLSRMVLEHYDLLDMLCARRERYAAFGAVVAQCDGLKPLFPLLDAQTCPWGYPMLMRGRAGRDQKLRASGVPFFTFAEVLHPKFHEAQLAPHVRDVALELSSQLICFPVHQQIDQSRYPGDWREIAAVMHS